MLQGLVRLIRHMDGLTGPATTEQMAELISHANVTRDDMINACKFNDKTYARTTLAKSDWYQLLVICWKYGQASPIHDHEGSSCAVRIVDGVATETMFAEVGDGVVEPMGKRELFKDQLTTANDTDIHVIENLQQRKELVTLHLYSPPLRMNYFNLTGAQS
ncbi:MAG: cysteine dioxygenase family protein [Planctomycetaceae bacterium]